MELVLPSAQYKDSFIEAVGEYKRERSAGPAARYGDLSVQELEQDFEAFVERERRQARGHGLRPGYVPEAVYWLVDGGAFIGSVSIRHALTPHLREVGGHIGYAVRPSKRGRGYGKTILKLALPKAKELGIEKVLLTCDVTNIASRKIIEGNGGVLESVVPNPDTGIEKNRFWIDIA